MKLRTKTLVITGVMLLSLIAIVYATSTGLVLHSFGELEDQMTRRDVKRALDTMDDKLAALQAQVMDYAAWDATYSFMAQPDDSYIASNLADEMFPITHLNLVALIGPSGHVEFAQGFDLNTRLRAAAPADLMARLREGQPLLRMLGRTDSTTGIVILDRGPMLFAAHAILTGQGNGPRRGTFIMGRYLDAAEIELLARVTHLSLNLHDLTRVPASADADAAQALRGQPGYSAGRAGAEEAAIVVRPLDGETIAGYTLLQDLEGAPVLMLRVNVTRAIYSEGLKTVQYFLIVLGIVGLAYGVLVLLFLERAVLARLARLSAGMARIGRERDFSARVPDDGNDELGQLGTTMNNMLSALHQSEGKYRHLAEQCFDGITLVDEDGTVLEWNASQERITGISRSAALDQPIGKIQAQIGTMDPPAAFDSAQQARAFRQTMDAGATHRFNRTTTHRIRRPDGECRVIEVLTYPIDTGTGLIVGSVTRDITERERAEDRYRDLFENAAEGIFQSSPAGRFIVVNPAMARMYGYTSPQEMIELVSDISRQVHSSPESRSRFVALLRANGRVEGFEAMNLRKDGTVFWTSTHARIVRSPDGAVLNFEGSVVDITARKQAEENLRHLSTHDALTGLHNRAHFEQVMIALEQSRLSPMNIAVVDVDGMKLANDSQGHAAGDSLLRRTATVLEGAFGDAVEIARIGGDEFAVLMPLADASATASATKRLTAVLDAHNAHNGDLPLSLSIGVAVATPGECPERVMQRADQLMYEDKRTHCRDRDGYAPRSAGGERA